MISQSETQERHSWRLCLLGAFRLERNGRPVKQFFSRRQDEVLAYVALEPSKRFDRKALTEALWGDRPALLAKNRLAEVLYLLRKELDAVSAGEILTTTPYTIQLTDGVTTDVDEYEGLVALAGQSEPSAERTRLLEEAIALYGDGLLPGMDSPPIRVHRARLAELYTYVAGLLMQESAFEGAGRVPSPASFEPADLVRARRLARLVGQEVRPVTSAKPPRPDSAPDVAELLARVEDAEALLWSGQEGDAIRKLRQDEADIDQAIASVISTGDRALSLRFVSALWRFWQKSRQVSKGRDVIAQAMSLPGLASPSAEMAARHGAGVLALEDGDNPFATQILLEARDGAISLSESVRLGRILHDLGILENRSGRHAAAINFHEQAIGILQSITGRMARECEARTWGDLARAALGLKDLQRARESQGRRLEIWKALDSQADIGRTLADLSTVAQVDADWPTARDLAEQALAVFAEDGNDADVAYMQRFLGYLEQESGQRSVARAYYQASLSMSRALENARGVGESQRYLGALARLEGDTVKSRELLDKARVTLTEIGDVEGTARVDEELALLASARQN